MSVTSVELLWEGRRGRDGIDRKRTYVRVYEVLTNDPEDDEQIAGGAEARALGLPGNADALEADPNAIVVDIDATTTDAAPTIWHVTVTYSTDWPADLAAESQTFDPMTGDSIPTGTAPGEDGGPPTSQRDQNPINWPIVYKVTHEQATEPATHDINGDPITNSAGDPFNPPIMVEKSYPVLTFVKYYAFVKIDWLEQFVDSVNDVPWHGRPARTCRMITLDWESDTVNNFAVWRVTFRVKVKPRDAWDGGVNDIGKGWDLRILDQGYRELSLLEGRSKIVPPIDDRGDPQPGPFLLDGVGQAAAAGAEPKYVTRRFYFEEDWGLLDI